MTELLPSVETTASRALEIVARRERVYVEGPVGAGRNRLLSKLTELEPRCVVLELLQLAEFDAPSVALLEIASQLDAGDAWPDWATGSEEELHNLARATGQRLADANRALLIRMPDSWLAVEGARPGANVLPSRARALLNGVFQSAAAVVLIADAALTPARLGFHAKARLPLRAHATRLDALDQVAWDGYRDVFDDLARRLPSDLAASPLAWRLAVGARALGARVDDLRGRLDSTVPLPGLAQSIVAQLKDHEAVRTAVRRFMAIRRPIAREEACAVSGVPDEHVPLILECIGYGAPETRVSTVLRAMFSQGLGVADDDSHAEFADHYAKSDGASSPIGLDGASLRSWCEKAHHLAHAGELGLEAWTQLNLVAPNLYWDRGRHLSQGLHDYDGAARVYRACVERFPEDDYAWHYLAFNLERAGGATDESLQAYRRAVELNPEHPWWNGRLITHLIESGKPTEAQAEWRNAIERVDPEGTQVRQGPWLANHLHLWVCRAWIRTGRYERARSVLSLVPRRFTSHGPLSHLRRRVDAGSITWQRFLARLEARGVVEPSHAREIRSWWDRLLGAQPDLPLPAADRTAEHGMFQFTWSYASLLLEVDVSEGGEVYWFGKDRISGECEDGSIGEGDETIPTSLASWLDKIARA